MEAKIREVFSLYIRPDSLEKFGYLIPLFKGKPFDGTRKYIGTELKRQGLILHDGEQLQDGYKYGGQIFDNVQYHLLKEQSESGDGESGLVNIGWFLIGTARLLK